MSEARPHILLVEDDAATRDAMALALELEGYKVVTQPVRVSGRVGKPVLQAEK